MKKTDRKIRILGIVGSPRKNGNTHLLVSRILEGAIAAGAVGDILFLRKLTIRECDGCHRCWKGRQCSKHDDMIGVYDQIIASDVIVFGTPVYWYGPTALMKGLLDRLVYFNCPENRAKIKGKSAILAVPFEENSLATADPVVAMFEKGLQYLEMNLIGRVLAPGVDEKGEILNHPQYLREGFELGEKAVRKKRIPE